MAAFPPSRPRPPAWFEGPALAPASEEHQALAAQAYCEVARELAAMVHFLKTVCDTAPSVPEPAWELSKRARDAQWAREAERVAAAVHDRAALDAELRYEYDPEAVLALSPAQIMAALQDYTLSGQLAAGAAVARVSRLQHRFLRLVKVNEWLITGDFGVAGLHSACGVALTLAALRRLSGPPASGSVRRLQLVPLKTLVAATVGYYEPIVDPRTGETRPAYTVADGTFGQQLMFQPIALFRLDGVANGAASALYTSTNGGNGSDGRPGSEALASARHEYLDAVEQSSGVVTCLQGPFFVDVFDLGPQWRDIVGRYQDESALKPPRGGAASGRSIGGGGAAAAAVPASPPSSKAAAPGTSSANTSVGTAAPAPAPGSGSRSEPAAAEASDAAAAVSPLCPSPPQDSLPYTYLTPPVLSRLLRAAAGAVPPGYEVSCRNSLGNADHGAFAGPCRSRPETPHGQAGLEQSWLAQRSARSEREHLMSPLSTASALGVTSQKLIPTWFRYQSVQLRTGEVLVLPPRYLVRLARNEHAGVAAQLYIARTTAVGSNGRGGDAWRVLVPDAHRCIPIPVAAQPPASSAAAPTQAAASPPQRPAQIMTRHGYSVAALPLRRSDAFLRGLSYGWIGLAPRSNCCDYLETFKHVDDMLSKLPLMEETWLARRLHLATADPLPEGVLQALDGEYELHSGSAVHVAAAAGGAGCGGTLTAAERIQQPIGMFMPQRARPVAARVGLVVPAAATVAPAAASAQRLALDTVASGTASAPVAARKGQRQQPVAVVLPPPPRWRVQVAEQLQSSDASTVLVALPTQVWKAASQLPEAHYSALRAMMRHLLNAVAHAALEEDFAARAAALGRLASACMSLPLPAATTTAAPRVTSGSAEDEAAPAASLDPPPPAKRPRHREPEASADAAEAEAGTTSRPRPQPRSLALDEQVLSL